MYRMNEIDLNKIGNADLLSMSAHRPKQPSPQPRDIEKKDENNQSKILHLESNLAERYFCGHTAEEHDLHGKCTKMTKTKWDKFSPYSFHKLGNQQKDQTFLQLYENYRGTKAKLNEQTHKIRRLNTQIHRLEAEISRLRSKGTTPGENYKIYKQKNEETENLKQQIKRLHQKIIALTGTKHKFVQRPKTANKPQKQIIPVNQNLKAELQQQRKHVRQLLLIIDELKKNKFDVQQMLKHKQAIQGNQSNVRTNKNKSNLMAINSQSQFQSYANDLHTWKEKYNDLQLAFNRMNEDKDKKIREISTELITLKQNQRMKERVERRGPAFDLSEAGRNDEKIRQITLEKEKLQDQLRRLVQMPFYQNNRQILDSQQKIKNLQIKYTRAKQQMVKLNENNTKFISQLEYKKRQNELLKGECEKAKKQLKEYMQKDKPKTGNITLDIDYDDYYRKMLSLVKLEGKDPVWKKFEEMAKPQIKLMTQQKVKAFAEKLWLDKLQLLAYLQKTQIQLNTMKQGMDSRINLYIRDKQILEEELKITRAKLDQWKCMDNINQRRTYKVFEQAGIKYDDSVSVFDIEQKQMRDLDSTENYFDLFLGNLNIDESVLMKNPQNKIKNTSHFISFLTIDFYNHETQHSNFAEGVMKKLGNNYSFKVEVNSYFLKFISKNTISLELWSPQGTATVLLGKGQIYLSELVNKAAQDISNVVRGKCQIYYSQKTLIATVEYRFRMRLPIYPFIQWAENKNQFKASESRDPFIVGKRRIIEVSVERAEGLPPIINSFVYFNIQQEDFFTQPERGGSPFWNYKQQIPVTVDEQFTNDLKQKYFEFTIFDDEKEVNEDIYGIAKANLTPLLTQTDALDLLLDIQDRNGDKKGRLHARVRWLTF